jgi:hypothetical protein
MLEKGFSGWLVAGGRDAEFEDIPRLAQAGGEFAQGLLIAMRYSNTAPLSFRR